MIEKDRVDIAEIVWQLQRYFNKHEAPFYSDALNWKTGELPVRDARRKFVKYYLEESRYATENFYKNY